MSCPTVTAPIFEHHHNGLGIQTARPRLSWRFETSEDTAAAWFQTAYEVEITFPRDGHVRTFHEASSQSVLVLWPARPLTSREAATVRVRVYGKSDGDPRYNSQEPSPWSPSATVEAGLLNDSDFQADFISPAKRIGPDGPLAPIRFRKGFKLPPDINQKRRARLYITALGVFEAWINGQPASDECMAPGWTSYKHRLAYRVYDVTPLLVPGDENVICVEVAEGWYAGRIGFNGGVRFRYGDELGLFAQLEVQEEQGTSSWKLLTDDSWEVAGSSITNSEIYDGETLDMRKERQGWNQATAQWPRSQTFSTKKLPRPSAKLVAVDAAPVRVTEVKNCTNIFKSKSGKTILDFGQNLVGRLRIRSVRLDEGAELVLRHAEVMENGELGVRPLRVAKCTDTIIGSGETLNDWSPRFTFHGFRYVQVDGWPGGVPALEDIDALVIHTDMKRRGYFECSNPYVNRLHQNVVWSMRGNFLSIPTDCPQRDERLGWTGDLQVFCPTASFLYDTMGILDSWLQDVAAEQLEPGKGGIPPLVVPNAISSNWPHMAQAIWDDVTVLTPGDLYRYSSDKDLLERQFKSMHAWISEGIDRAADGLWNPDKWQLGDWLDPCAPPDDPGNGRTDDILVADAYLIHTTQTFARLCAALGKKEMAEKYARDGDRLKTLFQRRYTTPEGNITSTSQTGISLAVCFDLYPQDAAQRRTAAAALEKLVRTARFNINTGFAGTPVITHALTAIGRPQLAYRMLLETKCPSWLYPVVSHDATTVWERWDSMLADGSINPGKMTSFNHYALGSIADWLHTSVGGISPLDPGWRTIKVRPVPGGNLTSAKTSFDGPHGLVACSWSLDEKGTFSMSLTVPPNCRAVVTLPSELSRNYGDTEEPTSTVNSGKHTFQCNFDAGQWPPKPRIAANQKQPEPSTAG